MSEQMLPEQKKRYHCPLYKLETSLKWVVSLYAPGATPASQSRSITVPVLHGEVTAEESSGGWVGWGVLSHAAPPQHTAY